MSKLVILKEHFWEYHLNRIDLAGAIYSQKGALVNLKRYRFLVFEHFQQHGIYRVKLAVEKMTLVGGAGCDAVTFSRERYLNVLHKDDEEILEILRKLDAKSGSNVEESSGLVETLRIIMFINFRTSR